MSKNIKITNRSNKELMTAIDELKIKCTDDKGSVSSLVVIIELLVSDDLLRLELMSKSI